MTQIERPGGADTSDDRPFLYTDPRALSLAWYSALYGGPQPERGPRNTREGGTVVGALCKTADEMRTTVRIPEREAMNAQSSRPLPANSKLTPEVDLRSRQTRTVRRQPPKAQEARESCASSEQVDVHSADGGAARILLQQHGSNAVSIHVAGHGSGLSAITREQERIVQALHAHGIAVTITVYPEDSAHD